MKPTIKAVIQEEYPGSERLRLTIFAAPKEGVTFQNCGALLLHPNEISLLLGRECPKTPYTEELDTDYGTLYIARWKWPARDTKEETP